MPSSPTMRSVIIWTSKSPFWVRLQTFFIMCCLFQQWLSFHLPFHTTLKPRARPFCNYSKEFECPELAVPYRWLECLLLEMALVAVTGFCALCQWGCSGCGENEDHYYPSDKFDLTQILYRLMESCEELFDHSKWCSESIILWIQSQFDADSRSYMRPNVVLADIDERVNWNVPPVSSILLKIGNDAVFHLGMKT